MPNADATKSMSIRARVVRDLIARHQEEFNQMLGDAREEAGLPRVSGGLTPEKRQARIEKHLKALRELGVEVPANNDEE